MDIGATICRPRKPDCVTLSRCGADCAAALTATPEAYPRRAVEKPRPKRSAPPSTPSGPRRVPRPPPAAQGLLASTMELPGGAWRRARRRRWRQRARRSRRAGGSSRAGGARLHPFRAAAARFSPADARFVASARRGNALDRAGGDRRTAGFSALMRKAVRDSGAARRRGRQNAFWCASPRNTVRNTILRSSHSDQLST